MAVDFISFFLRSISVSFWVCFPAGPSLVSIFSSTSGSCQQGGGMGSGCGFAGGAAVSPLQQKAGRRELSLCLTETGAAERVEEEGAAVRSGSLGDAAIDGGDWMRGEG